MYWPSDSEHKFLLLVELHRQDNHPNGLSIAQNTVQASTVVVLRKTKWATVQWIHFAIVSPQMVWTQVILVVIIFLSCHHYWNQKVNIYVSVGIIIRITDSNYDIV